MKLLEADEENLLDGKREMMGDLRKGEGGGIAAEEEIENKLLAGGQAGDQRATVAREAGRNCVVCGLGVFGEDFESRMRRDDGGHGRGGRNCRDEVEHELYRLARLSRRKYVAGLFAAILCAHCDLVATHDHCVHHRPDSGH